jgi:NifU-like protein involved in Fe-S cluster formation
MKGKTLEEAETITEDLFFQAVGEKSEDLRKKAKGLMELLTRGLIRYKAKISQNSLQESGIEKARQIMMS